LARSIEKSSRCDARLSGSGAAFSAARAWGERSAVAFTALLPDAERHTPTAQRRRAATSVPLTITEGAGGSRDPAFARFVGCAYRSLEKVVTALALCRRVYLSLPASAVTKHRAASVVTLMAHSSRLIDEGNQISQLTHSLIQRLGTSTAPRAWQRSWLTAQRSSLAGIVTLMAHRSALSAHRWRGSRRRRRVTRSCGRDRSPGE
jgi:four helix bundle protein